MTTGHKSPCAAVKGVIYALGVLLVLVSVASCTISGIVNKNTQLEIKINRIEVDLTHIKATLVRIEKRLEKDE